MPELSETIRRETEETTKESAIARVLKDKLDNCEKILDLLRENPDKMPFYSKFSESAHNDDYVKFTLKECEEHEDELDHETLERVKKIRESFNYFQDLYLVRMKERHADKWWRKKEE